MQWSSDEPIEESHYCQGDILVVRLRHKEVKWLVQDGHNLCYSSGSRKSPGYTQEVRAEAGVAEQLALNGRQQSLAAALSRKRMVFGE